MEKFALKIALNRDCAVFHKPPSNKLDGKFLEKINNHFISYGSKSELMYISVSPLSNLWSDKISITYNFIPEEIEWSEFNIDVNLMHKTCGTTKIGLAVGNIISCFILFNEE